MTEDLTHQLCRPIGAWHGNGRKAQWWSPVLLALRDTDTGRLVAVCKCMSGQALRAELQANTDRNFRVQR